MEGSVGGFHEQSDSEEETLERIFELLERGESVRLNMVDITAEKAQRVIDALREAGVEVIVPADN